MRVTANGLLVDGTRIIGRVQQFDLTVEQARKCKKCDEPIPLRIWDAHQHACQLNVRCSPIASFKHYPRKAQSRTESANRELTKVAQELAKLLA